MTSNTDLPARLAASFKAYDIRGRVPEELDADIAYAIGRAFVELTRPKQVAVGQDVRLSSPELASAVARGIMDAGADVLDIGLCGTEQVYHATFSRNLGGGIMVTASHNPMGYNGMKLVREDSRPVSGDSGLKEIQARVASQPEWRAPLRRGKLESVDLKRDYVRHLLGYVQLDRLKPLTIVTNAGNGCAGPVVDALEAELPFKFIKLQQEPDGRFPNGIPNPLLPENRAVTADAVQKHRADMGIAWDGDFDRCFFFDGEGGFVEGYYLVGLLARTLLARNPGAKIVHDPRLTWNTIETVKAAGGVPILSKTGHAFIKERMRREDALYGGEMSAHHYFRDFRYCDSGMIPWLLVAELISVTGKSLKQLVADQQAAFPVSGEINRVVADPDRVIAAVEKQYLSKATHMDQVDGLSLEYADWRFNLRKSNTEPILRLNVEARGDMQLMEKRTAELLGLIDSVGIPAQVAHA
ncbi:MAG TPA: phosphomannomutase [Gammaproteobacteria bacterium]|jgi:phosphomannomutase